MDKDGSRKPQTTGSKAAGAGRRSPWSRILLGLVLLATVVLVARNLSDLSALGRTLERAQPLWLLAALLLQVLTYVAVASGWSVVLTRAGSPQPLGRLVSIAIGKMFADQAVPGAGMGGNLLLVDRLVALGVPRGAAVAALLLSLLGYYIAYGSLTLSTLLLLWLHDHATTLLVGTATSFLIVAVAVPTLALWLRARGSRPLPPWIERLQPIANLVHILSEAPAGLLGDLRLIGCVVWRNGLVFLLDTLTLLVCLRALGQTVPVATCFIALMIASIVATMGLIPLGLGTFEASCAAMLSLLGIPLAVALAATLLLRGFTLWLPLVPGFLLARLAVHSRKGEPR